MEWSSATVVLVPRRNPLDPRARGRAWGKFVMP